MSREGMQGSQHGGEATEHGGRMEKNMRTRKKKKKKNPTGGNHGSSTTLGRRQKKPTVYTPQELHVQQESTAWSCVQTRPSVLWGLLQTAPVAGL